MPLEDDFAERVKVVAQDSPLEDDFAERVKIVDPPTRFNAAKADPAKQQPSSIPQAPAPHTWRGGMNAVADVTEKAGNYFDGGILEKGAHAVFGALDKTARAIARPVLVPMKEMLDQSAKDKFTGTMADFKPTDSGRDWGRLGQAFIAGLQPDPNLPDVYSFGLSAMSRQQAGPEAPPFQDTPELGATIERVVPQARKVYTAVNKALPESWQDKNPETMFNENGDIKPAQFLAQGIDFYTTNHLIGMLPPFSMLKFPTPVAKLKELEARRAAVIQMGELQKIGMDPMQAAKDAAAEYYRTTGKEVPAEFGQWKDAPARDAFLKPAPSEWMTTQSPTLKKAADFGAKVLNAELLPKALRNPHPGDWSEIANNLATQRNRAKVSEELRRLEDSVPDALRGAEGEALMTEFSPLLERIERKMPKEEPFPEPPPRAVEPPLEPVKPEVMPEIKAEIKGPKVDGPSPAERFDAEWGKQLDPARQRQSSAFDALEEYEQKNGRNTADPEWRRLKEANDNAAVEFRKLDDALEAQLPEAMKKWQRDNNVAESDWLKPERDKVSDKQVALESLSQSAPTVEPAPPQATPPVTPKAPPGPTRRAWKATNERQREVLKQLGIRVQEELPLEQRLLAEDKRTPGLAKEAREKYMEAPGFHSMWKENDVLEKLLMVEPKKQAALIKWLEDSADNTNKTLDFVQREGLDVKELGANKLNRIQEIFDELDAVRAKLEKKMSPELLAQEDALIKEIPQAYREYNATPGYFPANVSPAAKAGTPSKIGQQVPALNSKVDAARESVHGPLSGSPEIPGVRKTVFEMNRDRQYGSSMTEGKSAGGQEQSVWRKWLEPQGVTDIQRNAAQTEPGATLFERNANSAQGMDLVHPIYNALRAKDLDAFFTAGIRKQPPQAIQALKDAAREVELTWREDATKPQFLSPETAERVWKESGGVGPVKDLFNKEALAQEPFTKSITQEWHPNGYGKPVEINGKPVLMHGELTRQLETLKKLGTDTGKFGQWMRLNYPAVAWLQQSWKKNATFRGPQYFAFQLRNQIGDATRMYMFDGIDQVTPEEFAKTFAVDPNGKFSIKGGRAAEFLKTEDPDFFALTEFDWGPEGKINGAEAIRRMQQSTLELSGGQTQFEIMGEKGPRAGLVDNSYAAMASRASPKVVKPVVDWIDNAAEGMARWGAARELTNRITMFNALKRRGYTDTAAAIQTNHALIQFGRMSEAGHVMRDTIMPFASYHMKSYPMLLQYAMENPGRFLNQLRAFDELHSKADVDDKLLPEHMRGKGTFVTRKQTNEKGGIYTLGTRSGTFPHDDFLEFARQPGNKIKELIPLFQLMSDTQDALSKDDIWKSDTERWKRVAEDVIGRPASTYKIATRGEDPHTGTSKDWWQKSKDFFSPFSTRDINMTETRKSYVQKTDHEHKGSAGALRNAIARLEQAKAAGKTDLKEYESQVKHAEEVYERAKAEAERKGEVLK